MGFGSPGPIGMDDRTSGSSNKSGGGSGCGNVELTFVATFANPWKGKAAQELVSINSGKWNPGTDDFKAVAQHEKQKKVIEVSSFSDFLGGIQHEGGTNSKRVITRINILTHATSSLIAFSGKVDGTTGGVTLNNAQKWDDADKGLDITALSELRDPAMASFLAELRDKFCAGAQVFFYACQSGQGLGLLLFQDFAKTFQVTVKGFDDSIWYLPKKTQPLDRNFTALGPPPPAQPPTNPQRGFKHLDAKVQKTVTP